MGKIIRCPNCGSNSISLGPSRLYDVAVYKCDNCGTCRTIENFYESRNAEQDKSVKPDVVNHPSHYAGKIECIDYIRDKLTTEGFTEYCIGNVLKYVSRWRKKDGIQDLKKAAVYLGWATESAEKEDAEGQHEQ